MSAKQNDWTGFCITCKFFAQGKTCSYCENPKQTDKERQGYCYYDNKCGLWEEGTAPSRIEYMKKMKGK
jgi:hypothetical protein